MGLHAGKHHHQQGIGAEENVWQRCKNVLAQHTKAVQEGQLCLSITPIKTACDIKCITGSCTVSVLTAPPVFFPGCHSSFKLCTHPQRALFGRPARAARRRRAAGSCCGGASCPRHSAHDAQRSRHGQPCAHIRSSLPQKLPLETLRTSHKGLTIYILFKVGPLTHTDKGCM